MKARLLPHPRTLQPRRLKFIAFVPGHQFWHARGSPSQGEAETCHGGISCEIHAGMVFITRLMVVLGCVFVRLMDAQSSIVAIVLHTLVYADRCDSHAS